MAAQGRKTALLAELIAEAPLIFGIGRAVQRRCDPGLHKVSVVNSCLACRSRRAHVNLPLLRDQPSSQIDTSDLRKDRNCNVQQRRDCNPGDNVHLQPNLQAINQKL